MHPNHRGLPEPPLKSGASHDRTGAQPTDFDVGGETDPKIAALFPRLRLFASKSLVVHHFQAPVQGRVVVAAVVADPGGHLMWKLLLADEIPAPDFYRVHVQTLGHQVHDPFQEVRGLGPAGAPAGVHGSGVSEDSHHLRAHGRYVIHAGEHQTVQPGRDAGSRRGNVGSHVGPGLELQTQDLSFVGIGRFHVGHVVSPVGGAQEVLPPGFHPLDRAARLHGAECHDGLVGVHGDLAAEAAPDLGSHDPQLMLGNPQNAGEQQSMDMRILAGHPQRQLARGGIVLGHASSGLDGAGNHAMIARPELEDIVGVLEGLIQIAAAELEQKTSVGRRIVVDLGSPLFHGLRLIRHRVQDLVVHLDQLGGVLGLVTVLGQHDGHAVADVPDPIPGQRRMVRRLQIAVWNEPGRGYGTHPLHILPGKDGHDSRGRPSRFHVDGPDVGVGVGTANDGRVDHSRDHEVVRVLAASGEQPPILAALDWCTEKFGRHSSSSLACRFPHLAGRILDGVDDVLIPGATAQVPFQRMPDLGVVRIRISLQELDRGHQEAGSAEPALKSMLFPEGFLDRVQVSVRRQPLHRGDLGAVGLNRQQRARLHGQIAQQDGTRSTTGGVTTDVSPGQTQHLPKEVHQEQSWLHLPPIGRPIDSNLNGHLCHLLPPWMVVRTQGGRAKVQPLPSRLRFSKNSAASFRAIPEKRRLPTAARVPATRAFP